MDMSEWTCLEMNECEKEGHDNSEELATNSWTTLFTYCFINHFGGMDLALFTTPLQFASQHIQYAVTFAVLSG